MYAVIVTKEVHIEKWEKEGYELVSGRRRNDTYWQQFIMVKQDDEEQACGTEKPSARGIE